MENEEKGIVVKAYNIKVLYITVRSRYGLSITIICRKRKKFLPTYKNNPYICIRQLSSLFNDMSAGNVNIICPDVPFLELTLNKLLNIIKTKT